ncbi:MAG: hypothetical protein ABI778_08555, partial [Ignavibacteriota bacterium]
GNTPSWATLTAGSNITLTPGAGTLTIAASGGIANGTATDNTLRWNGTTWVETSNITSSAAGLLTVKAGASLSGATSPLSLNGSAGTSGQFLTSSGAGTTPTWTTGSLLPNGTATDNTLRWNGTNWVETANVKSSAAGLVTVNAGVNHNGATSPLQLNGAAGTSGQFLTSAGAGNTPTWTTGSLLPNGTATDNTLRWNGTNWVETANVKSSAAGLVTVNAGITFNNLTSPLKVRGSDGTTNFVLTSQGAGNTPQWTDPSSFLGGWGLTGNSGTTPGVAAGQNFLGTTDSKDFLIAANGVEHVRISSTAAGIASTTTGVMHVRSLLPGGASGLHYGTTLESQLPSTATSPGATIGGLSSISTVNNAFALSSFYGTNSSVTTTGTSNSTLIAASAGILATQNTTNGITHTSGIGVLGSLQQNSTSNNTTITDGAAFRSNFQLNSTNSHITNAHGLYIENPVLGAGVAGSAISNFNGIYIENLTSGTTRRALYYNGTGGNAPVAITSAGQLGIGRNDPTQALEIRNGNLLLSTNNSTVGQLMLMGPTTWGSHLTTFEVGLQGNDINYILPLNPPTNANQVLTATSYSGAGPYSVTLGWASAVGDYWNINGNSNTADEFYIGTNDDHTFEIHVFETDGANKGSRRVMLYDPNAISATITGGYSGNLIDGGLVGSIIAGGGASGKQNIIYNDWGVISGGSGNLIGTLATSNKYSTIAGGSSNTAAGTYNVISGGENNSITTTGDYSVIAGGRNLTLGANSFGVNMSSTSVDLSGSTYTAYLGDMNLWLGNKNNTARELRFYEPSSSGTNYTAFKALAQGADITYTLPTALPAASSGLMISSTAGALSWGANLAWDNSNYRLGANTTAPNTTVDANGDLAMREHGYTAGNGNNNNINIGAFSFVRISGPGAAFTITGIGSPVDGKMVILYNSTAQNMTISHNDANSNASNKIYTKGGGNVVLGQYGVATLIYNSTDSKWILVSTN